MLHLIRNDFLNEGIFGKLLRKDGDIIAATLEHSYATVSGEPFYVAKTPPGTYVCQKGWHRLKGMIKDFETFEIMGVPGATGILFHWGNYDQDSEGCVLLGTKREGQMVINSRTAFAYFMNLVEHKNDFFITIEEKR